MPNLVPQDINEWMRRMESRMTELTRRMSDLVPGTIENDVDLDGFMSTGRWYRTSNVGTTTALGYPANGVAGVLEVYQVPPFDQVIQVFINRLGPRHTRWWNGAVWSAWVAT